MRNDKLITILQDKSLTTKERGDALEDHIVDILEEYGIPSSKTKGSGALHGDGDVVTQEVTFDGKVKGDCVNSNVPREELDKIIIQAAKSDRVGAIVTPSIKDEKVTTYVTLKLTDLIGFILQE